MKATLTGDVIMKAIFTVMNPTRTAVEKIQACTEFEPMSSGMQVQCSTN